MKTEKGFFNQIENVLHSYEEAYVPGAWEEFRKEKKRKRGMLYIWMGSAAAILLLFSYIAAQFFVKPQLPVKPGQVNIHTPKNTPDSIKDNDKTKIGAPIIALDKTIVQPDKTIVAAETTVNKNTLPFIVKDSDHHIIADAVIANYNEKAPVTIEQKIKPDSGFKNPVKEILPVTTPLAGETKKIEKITRPVYDSIANELKGNKKYIAGNVKPAAIKKSEKNLAYGIVVSPSIGNQNVNFGTGVEIAYRLGGNLFLSSGVAYNSIHASTDGSSSVTLSNNHVQGVNLEVSGFEVPIGLQYKTKSGFYASAGVLAMTVIKDHMQYNYIADNTVASPVMAADGSYQTLLRVVTEKKTEESSGRVNKYLGFYTISVGKKTTFGNNQFNIGPFVKIPFGGVSSENIKLMQGGIHVGVGF